MILQVGTNHNKNIRRLAEALRGVRCKLQIVGELGPREAEILTRFNVNFSVSKNLTIDQLIEQYVSSDILSFVSTLEGFGLPIVEANAVGRVVVTSNVSSMPEVAGDAAHFVNPFDVNSIWEGILKVIEDDTYRERLIRNGYENRKRFDVQVVARQYADVYRSIDHG